MAKSKRILWQIERIDHGEVIQECKDDRGRVSRYRALMDEVRMTPFSANSKGVVGKPGIPLVCYSQIDADLARVSGNTSSLRLERLKSTVAEMVVRAWVRP